MKGCDRGAIRTKRPTIVRQPQHTTHGWNIVSMLRDWHTIFIQES